MKRLIGNMVQDEGRMSAKSALESKIKDVRRRMSALETIMEKLDWEDLTDAQEEILWGYFIRLGEK